MDAQRGLKIPFFIPPLPQPIPTFTDFSNLTPQFPAYRPAKVNTSPKPTYSKPSAIQGERKEATPPGGGEYPSFTDPEKKDDHSFQAKNALAQHTKAQLTRVYRSHKPFNRLNQHFSHNFNKFQNREQTPNQE